MAIKKISLDGEEITLDDLSYPQLEVLGQIGAQIEKKEKLEEKLEMLEELEPRIKKGFKFKGKVFEGKEELMNGIINKGFLQDLNNSRNEINHIKVKINNIKDNYRITTGESLELGDDEERARKDFEDFHISMVANIFCEDCIDEAKEVK